MRAITRISATLRLIASTAMVATALTAGAAVVPNGPAKASAATATTSTNKAAGTVCAPTDCPVHSQSVSTTATPGYWLVAGDGGMFSFGVPFYGSTGGKPLNKPIVGMAPSPDGRGYWLVASDGGIFSFGDAKYHGSTGAIKLVKPIVGIASDPATGGYWMVASDGGVFAFDAPYFGSAGNLHLNKPIVGMTSTPDGKGYWLVASDGGLFSYGDAHFHGSTGAISLKKPIVGIAADPATGGYWMVASDGGIFGFGAPFYGSTGAMTLNQPVVGMSPTPDGRGYWLVARDGGIFSYGDAHFHGSTGAMKLVQPVIGMAATPGGGSLTVKDTDLPPGVAGSIKITRPDGSSFTAPNGTTVFPAVPGKWTISASPVHAQGATYYPSPSKDVITLQPAAKATATIAYDNAASDLDRVVTPSAIKSVTAPDGSGNQTVVLTDSTHQLAAGDILISAVGPATPGGLLLHVISVTQNPDGTETVVGDQASLTDIGPAADLTGDETYNDTTATSNVRAPAATAGWSVQGTHKFNEDLSCTGSASAQVQAGIDFSPKVHFSLHWGGPFHPGTFTSQVSATGTLDAGVHESVTGGASCSYDHDLLATPIDMGEMDFQVGPVPVVVIPQLNFNLTADGEVKGSIESGVDETYSVTAGLDWNGSSLTPISGITNSFTYEPISPTFDGTLKASIGPKVTFAVYDVAGPYVRVAPDAELDVTLPDSPWWKLLAGIEAGAGIDFDMFGQDFSKGDDSIISKNWTVAQSSTPSPGEPLQITTSSLDPATEYQPYGAQLAATGGTSPYHWSASGLPAGLSLDASTGQIDGYPTQAGSFPLSVQVTDAKSHSTSGSLTLDVTSSTVGEPGSISGTVTDGTTAAPVAGVKVVVFGPKGFTPISTATDSSGKYEFTGVTAGTYDVCFDTSGVGGPTLSYADQCYQGAAWNGSTSYAAGAKTVTLGTGLGAQGIDAILDEAGWISGKVVDTTGAPLGNVQVDIDSLGGGGGYLATGTTGPDGTFDIGQIPPGYQTVCFNGALATGGTSTAGYDRQCFDGIPWDGQENEAEAGATRVLVTAGQTTDLTVVAGGPTVLPAGGSFSGTVKDTDGNPLGNVQVYTKVYDQYGHVIRENIVYTAADGTYTDQGLKAGTYQVCFDPSGETGGDSPTGYVPQCFGQPVPVQVDGNTPYINASIVPGGGISGHVTDSSGNSLAGAEVGIDGLSAVTDGSGNYSIIAVPAGTYSVCFEGQVLDHDGSYAYGYSCTPTNVTVVAKQITTGVDGVVPPGGAVAGKVTDSQGNPIPGAVVSVPFTDFSAVAGSDGTYQLLGLSAGTYDICFASAALTGATTSVGYLESCDPNITVTSGQETTEVNGTLQPAGQVTGTVTDTAGHPLSGVEVSSDSSGLPVSTRPDGSYTLDGLTPGSQKICFAGAYASGGESTTGYLPQCLTVSVGAGTPTPGVNAQLASGSALTGTVTDASGVAVPNVGIRVLDSNYQQVGSGFTLADGSYRALAIPTGSYYVCFDARGSVSTTEAPYGFLSQCDSSVTWYPTEWSPNYPPTDELAAVGLTDGAATTLDTQLTAAGRITGKVTDTGGNPLVDVGIEAEDPTGAVPVPQVATGPDGTYTITGLAPGTWSLCAMASGATSGSSQAGYLDLCGQGSPSVNVTAGSATEEDFSLQSAGGITGTVTDDAANLLSGARVTVYDSNMTEVAQRSTSTKGVFTVDRLVPGTYYICAQSPAVTTGSDQTTYYPYSDRCYEGVGWDGESSPPSGLTAITTTAGNLTTTDTVVLPRKGSISGTVTDASNHGLDGVQITVLDPGGAQVATGTTGSDGTFSILGLDEGGYDVCFDGASAVGPAGTGYASQCYEGVSWTGATPYPSGLTTLDVQPGADTGNLDVTLGQSGSMIGTVTDAGGHPLANVQVEISQSNPYRYYVGTTGSDGTYTVTDIPPGSYTVCFDASGAVGGDSTSGYADQCYNGVSWDGGTYPTGLTSVAITSGGISSANASLPAGATLAGTVTDSTDHPLSGVWVEIYRNKEVVAQAYTGADGKYSTGPLNAGDVDVCFLPGGASGGSAPYGYADQCYNSVPWGGGNLPTGMSPVVLTAGQTSNADATMVDDGQIAGTVTDTSANPLSGVAVSVFDSTGATVLYSADTAQDGSYSVDVAPGTYEVCFNGATASGAGGTGYGDICYQDATWDGQIPVTASASAVTVASDGSESVGASLPPAGTISGTVTDTSGNDVQGASVYVFDSSGDNVAVVSTKADGTYSVADVAPGSYHVCVSGTYASGPSSLGYGNQCYDGTAWDLGAVPSGATAVTVTAGQSDTGIDAVLAPLGGISGTVSDSVSSGVGGVHVEAYTPAGGYAGGATTASDGTYTVKDLHTGSYVVCFNGSGVGVTGDSSQCYQGVTWYPNSSLPAGTTQVPVSAGSAATNINATLVTDGAVSGTVSDSGGDPLSNVMVQAIDSSGHRTDSTTSSDGSYTIPGLTAGQYTVCFLGSSASYQTYVDGFGDQCYDGIAWDGSTIPSGATPVTVTGGEVATGIDGTLAAAGGISGTVTDSSGVALENVDVSITPSGGSGPSYSAGTQSDGTYTVTGIAPGTYTVCFEGRFATVSAGGTPSGGYGAQCYQDISWDGVSTRPTGNPVTVTASITTTGIDGALPVDGGISGTVTDSNGHPVAGALAEIIDSDNVDVYSATTGSDGTYSVPGLAPGSYRVCIYAQYLSGSGYTAAYQDECYTDAAWDGGSDYPAGATAVTVNAGTVTTGVDVSLPPGGAISGTVTDTSGHGLQGVTVDVFTSSYGVTVTATTDSSGNYVTGNLPPGTYGVCFDGSFATGGTSAAGYGDSCGNSDTYVDGAYYPVGAQVVNVTTGVTTTGVNGSLSASSRITGTVTDGSANPVANVEVYASDGSGNEYPAWTGSDGTYQVEVPPGTYSVCFQTSGTYSPSTGYANQCYKGVAWDGAYGDWSGTTPVTTTAGVITGGIDATLAPGGAIAGTVQDGSGDSLAEIEVLVYDTAGNVVATAFTGYDGSYSILSLSPGNYTVCFSDSYGYGGGATGGTSTTGYAGQCYDGVSWDGGTIPTEGVSPVGVVGGGTVSGVDATLEAAGAVSGTVTDTSGNPLPDVEVTVYDATSPVAYGYTGNDGTYTIDDITPGTYSVCFYGGFTGLTNEVFANECYSNVSWSGDGPPTGASPVSVSSAVTTPAIDQALTNVGTISGTVTDSADNPLANVTVEAISSGYPEYSTLTQPDGTYSFSGLASGSYLICFLSSGSTTGGASTTGYAPQCYNGQAWNGDAYEAAGTALSVTVGSNQTGINAALTPGGAISGKVTDSSGNPLSGVSVDVGGIGPEATTASDGTYQIVGLPASNTDEICFDGTGATGGSSNAGYLDQCYNGYSWNGYFGYGNSFTPVTVTIGSVTTNINGALPSASEISGKVTDSGGAGLQGVTVEVYNSSFSSYAITASDGTYIAPWLPPGTYEVCFDARSASGGSSASGYSDQCYSGVAWDGGSLPSSYTGVTTTAGSIYGGVDAALGDGGLISGTVTDGSSNGLSDVGISVTDSSGYEVGYGTTGADGTYTVEGLASGSYDVCFNGYGATGPLPYGYGSSCYSTGGATETAVTVTAGNTTANINGTLAPLGAISGTVTDASGHDLTYANVTVFDSSGNWVYGAATAPDGTYTVDHLAPGTYYVCFNGSGAMGGDSTTGYVDQCWNDVQWIGSSLPSGLTSVTVTSGNDTGGIDAALATGGAIGGTVTDTSTHPVPNVDVQVLTTGGIFVAGGHTDSNGNYSVQSLAPGTYDVCFSPYDYFETSSDGLAAQCYEADAWDGTSNYPAGMTGVPVSSGQTSTSIDASLSPAGGISGTVQTTGAAPVAGAVVDVYDTAGRYVTGEAVGSNGAYSIVGLTPGQYYVCFWLVDQTATTSGDGLASQCYSGVAWDGGSLPSGLQAVTVTSGTVTPNIGATAAPAGAISGTVTDSSNNPIAYADVLVYDNSGTYVYSTETAADGTYTIDNVTPGQYDVCFMPPYGSNLPGQCYNGVAWNGRTPLPSGLTTVTVTANQLANGVSAKL